MELQARGSTHMHVGAPVLGERAGGSQEQGSRLGAKSLPLHCRPRLHRCEGQAWAGAPR